MNLPKNVADLIESIENISQSIEDQYNSHDSIAAYVKTSKDLFQSPLIGELFKNDMNDDKNSYEYKDSLKKLQKTVMDLWNACSFRINSCNIQHNPSLLNIVRGFCYDILSSMIFSPSAESETSILEGL